MSFDACGACGNASCDGYHPEPPKFLVMATVETRAGLPASWERIIRAALTDAGLFVVKADAEVIRDAAAETKP